MSKFWRKYHRWISIFIAIPFLVTIITGILLLFRGQAEWISPKFPEGSGQLSIGLEQILKAAQSVPELKIETWKDVNRVTIRPDKGSIAVRSKNSDLEIQIDGGTGEVLGSGISRSSFLVSLHEGTILGGNIGRFAIALPVAIGVLFLLVSGVVLFFQPQLMRRKRKFGA